MVALTPLCFEKSQLAVCLLTALQGQESTKSHVWQHIAYNVADDASGD